MNQPVMNGHVALLVERLPCSEESMAASVSAEKDKEKVGLLASETNKVSSAPTPLPVREDSFKNCNENAVCDMPDYNKFHDVECGNDKFGSSNNKFGADGNDQYFISSGDFRSLNECRICQEEDELSNLESPCACAGSLKFAHRECVQHWCNEKGDTNCEICCKPYQGGYTAPPTSSRANSFAINIGNSWDIASGQRLHLHEPALFTVTSDQHFMEAEYEEYRRANARSAACFRSVALILMVILVLRHVLSMTTTVAEEDASTLVTLFFLRTAGFFLPCYIVARALNSLQWRQQEQDSADDEPDVAAYIIQTRPAEGVRIVLSAE